MEKIPRAQCRDFKRTVWILQFDLFTFTLVYHFFKRWSFILSCIPFFGDMIQSCLRWFKEKKTYKKTTHHPRVLPPFLSPPPTTTGGPEVLWSTRSSLEVTQAATEIPQDHPLQPSTVEVPVAQRPENWTNGCWKRVLFPWRIHGTAETVYLPIHGKVDVYGLSCR